MYIGSHVSMKAPNYFKGAVQEALSYGANALMIYTGAPQNSRRVDVSKFQIAQAQKLMEENGLLPQNVIVHAPYIINLANTKNLDTFSFGVDFLKKELLRVESMGLSTLILHPGSHVGSGLEAGIQQIIRGLNEVLEEDPTSVRIALETMAGKGTECGFTFEQLKQIREGVHKKERIYFCLDTCHISDAGYDLQDVESVLQTFDTVLGLENLACIHINDSKNPCGARKDRHENIGKGTIGFDGIHHIVHHPLLKEVPKILETPYIDGKAPYKDEISRLRNND